MRARVYVIHEKSCLIERERERERDLTSDYDEKDEMCYYEESVRVYMSRLYIYNSTSVSVILV